MNTGRAAGNIATAQITLFLYMLFMKFNVETILIVMAYLTGILSILLFSATAEIYQKPKDIAPIFVLGITTFISSYFLKIYILRWVPVVAQSVGISARRKAISSDIGIATMTVFTLLYLILNVISEFSLIINL